MGKKKDIIKEALMTAKEIENAALENAHSTLIENYSPKLISFIKESLDDEYMSDEDDDEETLDEIFGDEEMDEKEEVEEGSEHDLGKQDGKEYIRDLGTDEEDNLSEAEGWDSEHPTTAARNAKFSASEWDKDHWGTMQKDPGKNEKRLPGTDYASKKSGSDQAVPSSKDPAKGENLEGQEVANKTSGGVKKPPTKDPGIKDDLPGKRVKGLSEAQFGDQEEFEDEPGLDEPVGDEDVFQSEEPTQKTGEDDFEIPDELFDDDELETGEKLPEAEGEEGDEEYSEEDGGEDDIDKLLAMLDSGGDEFGDESGEDFGDEEFGEESLEEPMGDEPELPMDDAEMADDDDLEEGLYLRKGGEYAKVTPTQYFENRIGELEEEREQLSNAVNFLKTQLQEVNLFNAKLANATKLFETNLFTSNEKINITEQLDSCTSVKEVNSITKKILGEAKVRNPLDNIQHVLREQRELRNNPSKDIYESKEVKRLRRLAGLE